MPRPPAASATLFAAKGRRSRGRRDENRRKPWHLLPLGSSAAKTSGRREGWFASAFSMRESDPLPRMQRLMNPKFRIWDLHCHLSGVPGLTPEEPLGQLLG